MKIIAAKIMSIQIKITSDISFFFGTLCFEADRLGELTRQEDKEYNLDMNLVTTEVASIGSVFEIRKVMITTHRWDQGQDQKHTEA